MNSNRLGSFKVPRTEGADCRPGQLWFVSKCRNRAQSSKSKWLQQRSERQQRTRERERRRKRRRWKKQLQTHKYVCTHLQQEPVPHTCLKAKEKRELSSILAAIGHFSCCQHGHKGRWQGKGTGTGRMWLLIGVHLNSWMTWTLTNHLSNHGQESRDCCRPSLPLSLSESVRVANRYAMSPHVCGCV